MTAASPGAFLALPNLASSALEPAVYPWEFKFEAPDILRRDKSARDRWITAKATRHHVYGVAWGMNPRQRVVKPSRTTEGNPPHTLWGFAADYDAPADPEDVAKACARLKEGLRPVWYERTLSGNARLVWVFERGILVPSFDFASAYLTRVATALKANTVLAGLDLTASINPSRYFTNAGDWRLVEGGTALPADLLEGWLVETGSKYRFDKDSETSAVAVGDMEAIRTALAAKYPRFSEWPGEFAVGAMGPSFWVDGSESPKSATVREGGMQTYSAHATRAWYSWAELLDAQTVATLVTTNIGALTRDIYFDTRAYWIPDPARDTWIDLPPSEFETYLIERRGATRKVGEDGVSMLAKAKLHIAMEHRVKNVGHAVFFPKGVIEGPSREPFLNISSRRPLPPADERGMEWGRHGQFPTISEYYDNLIPDDAARWALLGWVSYAYGTAYAGRPGQGQIAILVGPSSVGKSVHAKCILGRLFRSLADASAYLHGHDSFGGELFESFLLRSDDNGLFVDARTRGVAAERMKVLAANTEHRSHTKFKMPILTHWCGRLCVTVNDDPDSLSALPEITRSVEGKISLWRTSSMPSPVFTRDRTLVDEALDREVAFFARWLLEHPPHSLGVELDPRFGVAAYHDASLLRESRSQSSSSMVADLIDRARKGMRLDKPWRGSIVDLRLLLAAEPAVESLVRTINHDRFRRDVLKLASGQCEWMHVDREGHVILDPAPSEPGDDPAPRADIRTKADSKYEKK